MKKYILMAAAAIFALAGCVEDQVKPVEPTPEVDSIELSDNVAEFGVAGGDFDVLVSSSVDWTLTPAAEYDWVVASAESGVDGDIVTFTATENFEADKTAEFTFQAGEAVAKFNVTSKAGEKPAGPSLSLIGDAELSMDYNGGRLEILVATSLAYRDVAVAVTEGTEEWCKYVVSVEGDEEGQVKLVFDIPALEGLDDRTSEITFSGEGVEPVKVTFTQYAKLVLNTSAPSYTILPAGGVLEIPVEANVEYSINIPEDAQSWISHSKKEGATEFFDVIPLESGLRQTNITLSQTDAKEGVAPLQCTFTVFQMTALVSFAAQMDNARLYIKDAGTLPSEDYSELTIECLINSDAFDHVRSTIWNASDNLTFRFGDEGDKTVKKNFPELVTPNNKWAPMFFVYSGMSEKEWHHIAFSFSHGRYRVYIDGLPQTVIDQSLADQTISPFSNWAFNAADQKGFFIGFGQNAEEDFHGMITEFRIWKKAFGDKDLSAEDHFYNVDPTSEGLMLYWKFDAGKGNIIKNRASGPDALKGNDLYGETNVRASGSSVVGDAGIVWKSVKLPEE